MTAEDWATVASLATALGTLVLAVATFSAVRSGNRTARAAELSLLTSLRPLLAPSRRSDGVLKMFRCQPAPWTGSGDTQDTRDPHGSPGRAADATDRPVWTLTVARHWSIDRPDPRRADRPSD